MKFNQFTFWNMQKPKEHISLRFYNRTITALSRDVNRAVRAEWRPIGAHTLDDDGIRVVCFNVAAPHLWVASSILARSARVIGATCRFDAALTFAATTRATNPETLIGCKHLRSLDLGHIAAGERGAYVAGRRFERGPAVAHRMAAMIRARARK